MNEKPFKDDFEYKTRIMNYLSAMSCGDPMGVTENIFRLIEADREAIRAETREELLRDHFKIGEAISYDSATDGSERNGHVRIVDDMSQDGGDEYYVQWEHNARRPPKKRAMTRVEMVSRVREAYSIRREEASQLKETTLIDLLQNRGISTEVDE